MSKKFKKAKICPCFPTGKKNLPFVRKFEGTMRNKKEETSDCMLWICLLFCMLQP